MLPSPTTDYRERLRDEFLKRKARNPQLSLRAFSSHLKVSRTVMSDVLSNKRHLSEKNALKISEQLGFTSDEKKQLLAEIQGLGATTLSAVKFNEIGDNTFQLISEWYYYAILNLARLKANKGTPEWVASQLGISVLEARSALLKLESLGYLKIVNRKLQRQVGSLNTQTPTTSQARNRYHKQNLLLAERSIDTHPLEEREFGAMTMSIDSKKLPKAKEMIREFKVRLANYLESQNGDRVYTLSVQLFPISKGKNKSA